MAINDSLKAEAWASESDQPFLLLKIDHADLAQPIRVVNNKEDVISNGETFVGFPFEIPLPDNIEDAPPRTRLQISNVSREIGQAIRLINTPASVTLEIVQQSDLDTIQFTFPGMRLTNAQLDALTVTGDLSFEDLVREPYPSKTFSPAEYPGLIR